MNKIIAGIVKRIGIGTVILCFDLFFLILTALTRFQDPTDATKEWDTLKREIKQTHLSIPNSEWSCYTVPMTYEESQSILNRLYEYEHHLFADFTIYNMSDYAIEDLVITFQISGHCADALTISTKIQKTIPARGQKRIENIKVGAIGPGKWRARCWVNDFKIVEFEAT